MSVADDRTDSHDPIGWCAGSQAPANVVQLQRAICTFLCTFPSAEVTILSDSSGDRDLRF
jgi:hypothetical protein